MTILSDRHLRRIIGEYGTYTNRARPHQTLNEHVPSEKPRSLTAAVVLGLTNHVWTVVEFLNSPLLTPLARSGPSGPLVWAGRRCGGMTP